MSNSRVSFPSNNKPELGGSKEEASLLAELINVYTFTFIQQSGLRSKDISRTTNESVAWLILYKLSWLAFNCTRKMLVETNLCFLSDLGRLQISLPLSNCSLLEGKNEASKVKTRQVHTKVLFWKRIFWDRADPSNGIKG